MKTVFSCICVLTIIAFVGHYLWFADRGATLARQQFDPIELQRKYEWFKNAAAALDSRLADLRTYDTKILAMKSIGIPDRTDREQLMTWLQEQQGVKLSYNDLAAEYNSQMSKWNWRFCNTGGLPPGASQILPRAYKPYIEQ